MGGEGGRKSAFFWKFRKVSQNFVRDCLEILFGGITHVLGDSGLFFPGIITFIPTQLFVKYLFLSMTSACFVHLFVSFATTQFIDISGQNMYIILLFANYPVYIHIIMHRNRKIRL